LFLRRRLTSKKLYKPLTNRLQRIYIALDRNINQLKYIALSILLNLYLFAFSQENNKIGFSFNSGITFSIPLQKEATQFYTDVNINGSERTKYYPSHGFFIDLLLNKSLASNQTFSFGLNYSKYSVRVHDLGFFREQKGNIESTLLNLPILFNFKYSNSSKFSFTYGTYLTLILDVIEKGTSYDALNNPRKVPENQYNFNIKSDYNPIDMGLIIQQNFEHKISKKLNLNIFARLNLGVTNVISKDVFNRKTEYSAADRWSNTYISIGTGLRVL